MGECMSMCLDQEDEVTPVAPPPKYLTIPNMDRPEYDFRMELEKLRGELATFPNAGIVSFGPVGVGKSSLMNTIASFLNNRLELAAGAGTGATSLTLDITVHHLRVFGKPVQWKWLDTPGDFFIKLEKAYAKTLFGEFDIRRLSPEAYGAMVHDELVKYMRAQGVGCVMVVLSALQCTVGTRKRTLANGTPVFEVTEGSNFSQQLAMLKDLYRRLLQAEMRMVCMLTKVDEVDAKIAERVTNIKYSADISALRQLISTEIGIPANQVYCVVNFTRFGEPSEHADLGFMALFGLRNALAAAGHGAA